MCQIFSPVDGVVADLLRGVQDGGEGGDQGGEAGLQPRAALHQLLKQRELDLGFSNSFMCLSKIMMLLQMVNDPSYAAITLLNYCTFISIYSYSASNYAPSLEQG